MKKVLLLLSILLFVFIIYQGLKQQNDYLKIGGGILLGLSVSEVLKSIRKFMK